MIKYLDTSTLTKYTSGNNKGHFNWKENIGTELPFQYDDLEGIIKIIDYKSINRKNLITIQYQNNIMTTSTSNLLQLKIPTFLNKNVNTRKYKYNVGDIIDKDFQKSKVMEQCKVYSKTKHYNVVRGYKLKCLSCGYTYITREDRLSSCPVCGIRSSWTERFIFSIFIQAEIKFEVQKEFDWLQNRWYDIYLQKYNAVVEINGVQHYEPIKLPSREQKSAQIIHEECIKADEVKQNAALQHNISYYAIDAREQSNLFEIAKQTLSFIDFSNVSEFECGKFATQNIVSKYYKLWNKGYSLKQISNKLDCSIQVVQAKLRQANTYNLCNYDKILNMKNHRVTNPNK